MDKRCLVLFVLLLPSNAWNNLNCPAPRAPINGLSFIFRDGALVHYRCHPGYVMQGKPVAYCLDNEWTQPAPECLRVRKFSSEVSPENYKHLSNYRTHKSSSNHHGQMFYWDDKPSPRQGIYGEGPRRLPLINGIWPPEVLRNSVLPLNIREGPGPKEVVKEEIDIAELRERQLEELKRHRYSRRKAHRPRRTYQHREKNRSHFQPEHPRLVHSRPSRVETHHPYAYPTGRRAYLELGSRPQLLVRQPESVAAAFDTSCVEILFGREVPMRAPQVPNAFVFHYETRRNPHFPFNSYMLVRYRCRNGYVLQEPSAGTTLYCQEAAWVGEKPTCRPATDENEY